MSEITSNGRDAKTGQFLKGCKGGGGRKPGSRQKLGELFVSDLRDAWNAFGVEALRRCAEDEPAQFVRVVSSLLPRDISLTVGVDAASFVAQFRDVRAALGNDEPPQLGDRLRMLEIEHDDGA